MAAQNNFTSFLNKSNIISSSEALFDSIRRREKADTILTLIQQGADIDARNSRGYTPLLLASKYGLKTVVKLLIDSGAKVDGSVCPYKRTLLHYASGHGWAEIAQFFLKRISVLPFTVHKDSSASSEESMCPIIHAKDVFGRTALHLASLYGHLEIVRDLVEQGANVAVENEGGKTALHEASQKGHLEVVKLLLENGAKLDARDKNDCVALHGASVGGHLQVVKYLLAKGADPDAKNEYGLTAMLMAAEFLSFDVIVLLINLGASIDCCDCNKLTILHYAAYYGWIEMVQYLVKRMPVQPFILRRNTTNFCEEYINLKEKHGKTALDIAASCGYLKVVKFLVAEGADLNLRNDNGKTALIEASFHGHLEVVKFLAGAGADLNIRDKDGKTALHELSHKDLEIVKYLVELGADMNVKNCDGATPLLVAALYSCKDVVEWFVSSGANLDCCNQNGDTVLHFASRKGWVEIVQSIVNRVSDLDARDSLGQTALLTASVAQQLDCVKYLLHAGARWDIPNIYGNLPLGFTWMSYFSAEFFKLFIAAGAYLRHVDYYELVHGMIPNNQLLRDVQFCSQAIINEFNSYQLPALYKLPASACLPRIEKMLITNDSEVAQGIERIVKLEIQRNGQCNVPEVRPMALSVFAVRSLLDYYDEKKYSITKAVKRQAASDSNNERQHMSKSMRLC